MGYAMMWLEWLAAAILFVVVTTACLSRMKRPWLRIGFSVAAALLPIAKGSVIVYIFAYIAMITLRPWYAYHWFLFWFSWMACSATGIVLVLVAGLRRRGEPSPGAASWPRGKLALGLAAALVLGWITFWNIDLSVRNSLTALRAEAGAMALSVAPARPPDSENAAPVYREACDAMVKGDELPPEFGEKWTEWLGARSPTIMPTTVAASAADFDPADPKLEAFLARSSGAIGLLRRAAAVPACYFDYGYSRPSFHTALPEMSDFLRAAKLLALDARVKTAQGQLPRAMEDIRAIFGMSRHSAESPILVSLLVAAAVDEIGVAALEAVLNSSRPEAALLAGLNLSPPGMLQRNLPRAFRMVEALGLSAVVDVGLGDDPVAVEYALGSQYPKSAFLIEYVLAGGRIFLSQEEVAAYRSCMHECRRLADLPYYEAVSGWKMLDNPEAICRRGMLVKILMPAIVPCAKRLARGDARHGVAYVAVAAARYRAEKGRMPETLDALVPEYLHAVPRDPFDGKPLRMVARDGSLVFYSIGPDMKDDGGAALDEKNSTGDITFSLPLN